MRYFRRSGPSQLVVDGTGLKRFIEGPDPVSQTPGGILAYDDTDPIQARFAEQFSRTPGWYEIDKDGTPIFPEPKTAPEVTEPGPPAEVRAVGGEVSPIGLTFGGDVDVVIPTPAVSTTLAEEPATSNEETVTTEQPAEAG